MKILNNIATKERLFVIGCFLSSIVCITVCLGAMVLYKNATDKANQEKRNEVYVAVNGDIIKAQLMEDFSQPLSLAHKGFLKLFHNYVWSVEPNEKYIEKNKAIAKEMADSSVEILFRFLESDGYYSSLISGDYSVLFNVEENDIEIDYTKDLPEFTLTGTLKTLQKNEVVVKKVITVGKIVQNSYGFSNFSGFKVVDLKVLEFKELERIKYKEL